MALLTPLSSRGVPPLPSSPQSPLLFLSTFLVLKRLGLRLLLVGGAAAARAREARVVGVAGVEAVVEAVVAEEEAVGVAGVGVGVLVPGSVVAAAVGVAVAGVAAVGVAAAPVAAVVVVRPSTAVLEQQRQCAPRTPHELPEWYA
ncbi:unnamed protein product [Closterium sp. Yama58-4]|nr:unnamed protein product [Closterium sp. Yama58-4]